MSAWISVLLSLLSAEVIAQPQDMLQVLEMHNQLRCEHQVPPVFWDEELARQAQQRADHRHFHRSGKLGENVAWGPIPNGAAATKFWYAEIQATHPYGLVEGTSAATSQYSQVIWRDTTKIGCGTSSRGRRNTAVWVCRYAPAGNTGDSSNFRKQVLPPSKSPDLCGAAFPLMPEPEAEPEAEPLQAPPEPEAEPSPPTFAPPTLPPTTTPDPAIPAPAEGAVVQTLTWAFQGADSCEETGFMGIVACEDTVNPSLCSRSDYLLVDFGVSGSKAGLPIGSTADRTLAFERDGEDAATQIQITPLTGRIVFSGCGTDTEGALVLKVNDDVRVFRLRIRTDGIGEVLMTSRTGKLKASCSGQMYLMLNQ